jgi:hypothetical protein
MSGATTSPNTGKTKFWHHAVIRPALPPVSLTRLLVIVSGATTSPNSGETKLWHQRGPETQHIDHLVMVAPAVARASGSGGQQNVLRDLNPCP